MACFNMQSAKFVSTHLAKHFKFSDKLSPQTEDEEEHISRVPYSSVVSSIMYAMVCTTPNISQAVSVVSRYMKRLDKTYGEVVK